MLLAYYCTLLAYYCTFGTNKDNNNNSSYREIYLVDQQDAV